MTSRAKPAASARELRADAWLAALVFAVSAVLVLVAGDLTASLMTPLWIPVAAIQCSAIVLRRRSPAVALAIAWLGAMLQLALVQEVGPQNVAFILVLYSVAAYGSRRVRAFSLVSALAGGVVAGWFVARTVPLAAGREAGPLKFIVGLCIAILLLAWLIGLVRGVSRRAAEDRFEARVAAEQAWNAVAVEEERARIARDMHDVVAHSLTVMIAQAEGARLVAETRGATDPGSLDTIAETGRAALTEVRVLLAGLRSGERDSPQPSLDRLDALLAALRDTGAAVSFTSTGSAWRLPPQLDMAAFRIIQEALTNAVRHGDRARPISLRLEWTDTELRVTVTNAVSPRAAGSASGHGIAGMRERARFVGGSLTAAADREGSFAVAATLPLERKVSL